MKYLILLLISLSSFSQTRVPSIPLSDAQKYVAAKSVDELNFFKHTCVSKPDEPCLIAECAPEYSKIETRTSYDEATGITTETKVLVCDPEKEALIKASEKLKEDELKAKEDKKKAACDDLEKADIDKATTIAALRAIIKNFKECIR